MPCLNTFRISAKKAKKQEKKQQNLSLFFSFLLEVTIFFAELFLAFFIIFQRSNMATIVSWFRVLRWSLILTLILIIILYLAPLAFPKNYPKDGVHTMNEYKISSAILLGLCIFGLFAIWCHFVYMTLIFGCLMLVYLITDLVVYRMGNIGTYLPIAGIIICSFTLAAALRRLKHDAMYGA